MLRLLLSRFTLVVALVLSFSIIVFAQSKTTPQTKSNQQCNIKKPPVLRGFYISQTVEEINELIPHFQEIFNEKRAWSNRPEFQTARDEAGFILLTDTDVFYPQLGERVVPREEYKDVEFFWHFLDGKLMFLSVNYKEFEPTNIKTFVQQVAEKTNLPTQGWRFVDRDHAVLKCTGFIVDVFTGRDASRPNYESYPSVMLTDTIADAELTKREKEIKLRKKNAELEQLRREREKRAIFKP